MGLFTGHGTSNLSIKNLQGKAHSSEILTYTECEI